MLINTLHITILVRYVRNDRKHSDSILCTKIKYNDFFRVKFKKYDGSFQNAGITLKARVTTQINAFIGNYSDIEQVKGNFSLAQYTYSIILQNVSILFLML